MEDRPGAETHYQAVQWPLHAMAHIPHILWLPPVPAEDDNRLLEEKAH